MIVNTREILTAAQQGNYAAAAFNVYNQETVQAAVARPNTRVSLLLLHLVSDTFLL